MQTLASSRYQIEEAISHADLVIGAVLVVGVAAKLVTRDMLHLIPQGAVLVDVAVDQGGCFETTRATTHSNPTYYEEGVLHYCVANMPGAVPRTSTFALTNATLPYALDLANKGFERAIADDAGLWEGVNTYAAVHLRGSSNLAEHRIHAALKPHRWRQDGRGLERSYQWPVVSGKLITLRLL